ncbi:hypothetical protein DUNSADRAFT_8996 [Dunaliella salina]|uniref:Pentacotripeptide-repeat region of PRORP domain-containing protein n=1 Tax=Dunaliella salina TaxID=3046 RepID=A0ABQ7GIE8_DUNSA|nr:hypothetical protein DUNSADRAFT_8996 [Dunaliella salina]|eukprot:KAF5834373.1 hypothetical protein DUNSADRAFT_8996 [Dunaliella salina]
MPCFLNSLQITAVASFNLSSHATMLNTTHKLLTGAACMPLRQASGQPVSPQNGVTSNSQNISRCCACERALKSVIKRRCKSLLRLSSNVAYKSLLQLSSNVACKSLLRLSSNVACKTLLRWSSNVACKSLLRLSSNVACKSLLALRQASGQPVSCAMMNIVLRGLALGGEVDACGRLFEEYKVAGLPHDFAAYNAVIESCCVAKKPQAAYGVLDYMATQNVAPGTDTYDLLLRAFVSAEDVDGALEALQRLRKDNARAKYSTVLAGLNLARRTYHRAALSAFQQELAALDAYERRQQLLEQQQEQQQQQQQQQLGAPVGEDGLESWAYEGGDAGFEGVPGEVWDGGEGDEGRYGYDGFEEEGGGQEEVHYDDDGRY